MNAQAIYVAFRVLYLWSTFSGWHTAGFVLLLTAYLVLYGFLRRAAAPTYRADGVLLDGGADMDAKGVTECAPAACPRQLSPACGPSDVLLVR